MPISEWERLHREAARYKEMYPKGTRVVLGHMDDPYSAVPPGQFKMWIPLDRFMYIGTMVVG